MALFSKSLSVTAKVFVLLLAAAAFLAAYLYAPHATSPSSYSAARASSAATNR